MEYQIIKINFLNSFTALSLAIFLYSFRAIAHGWTPSVMAHPLRKKVSTRSHVLLSKSFSVWFIYTQKV